VVSIGNLVIAGPSLVVFPRLSKAHIDGHKDELLIETIRLLRLVLACSLPIAISVGILAKPIVILLFERGAFVREDALNVAELLPWMLLGMVPMLCVVMIFRALFARQDIVSAFALGALTTTLYFVLSGLFIRQSNVIGIAIAYLITWSIVFFIAIYRLCRSDLKRLAQIENMLFAKRIGLLLLFTGAVAVLGNFWLINGNLSSANLGIRLVAVGALCSITYCTLATRVIALDEIILIINYFYRKVAAIADSKNYKI
jgi:putative peptidoglycan lipid II flippase